MTYQLTETKFRATLREYLDSIDGPGEEIPVIQSRAGLINRVKTLALPCYENFPDKAKWLDEVKP